MGEIMANQLSEFLNAIDNISLVDEIAKLVFTKTSGTISICFPKDTRRQGEMHFLIDMESKDLFVLSELTTAIKEKLGYDYTADDGAEIVIHHKKLFDENAINNLYVDITPITKENFNNIELFLARHYPEFFKSKQKENMISESHPSQFWSKAGSEGAISQNLDAELIAYLKANPTLWSRLVNSPDSLDAVKSAILKESPRNASTIPVK